MKLILYHFASCPYCKRVRDFIQMHGLTSIEQRDILENPGYRNELIATGKKSQVPCLVIDGKAMYESLDIMDWLRKHYQL